MNLTSLYQEVILDHNRNPCNFGILADATNVANGHNPLCGDELKIYLRMSDDNTVEKINFTGRGCAICMASASLLTENVIGKSTKEIQDIFQRVHVMLTKGKIDDDLGKLTVLGGAANYPSRVKCAILAWRTLVAALENVVDSVTTE